MKLTYDLCREFIKKALFTPAILNNSTKPNIPGHVGVELEIFSTINIEGIINPAKLFGQNGIADFLAANLEDIEVTRKIKDEGLIYIDKILFTDGDCIRFEPGGQIEIITIPRNSIIEMDKQLRFKFLEIKRILESNGYELLYSGCHPFCNIETIGMQIPADRYKTMRAYFNSLNPLGEKMMLQTCSLHVNLDFGLDDETLVKRFCAASLITPFAIAIFANSPNISAKKTNYHSYRNFLWQNLDNLRTGILPLDKIIGTWNKDALIEAYLEFALKAPVIYIEDFGDCYFPAAFTFKHWLNNDIEGIRPEIRHLQNHLSMLFPYVRPKGYLELRTIDTQDPQWQTIPALFYSGLLYNPTQLDNVLSILTKFIPDIKSLLHLACKGLLDKRIASICNKLMNMAIDGLSELPDTYQTTENVNELKTYAAKYTFMKKCPADDVKSIL